MHDRRRSAVGFSPAKAVCPSIITIVAAAIPCVSMKTPILPAQCKLRVARFGFNAHIIRASRAARDLNRSTVLLGDNVFALRPMLPAPRRPAIARQLLQRHWDSERLPAQFGNSVACGTMISRSAFYPTVPDHVAEYSFACRRQSLMWRLLRLHELLQKVPLPHVGIGTAHFSLIHYQRTEIPSQRTIGSHQQRRQRHLSRPQTVSPSCRIKIPLHRIWNARRRAA